MIFSYLKKETFGITGTAAYDLPDYTPNDTDICIVCRNTNDEFDRIAEKIKSFAKDHSAEVEWVEDYRASFDWGGRTFARTNVLQYDVFLVSHRTFRTIQVVTYFLKNMPLGVKEEMAKDKVFRVNLFRMIAERVYCSYS